MSRFSKTASLLLRSVLLLALAALCSAAFAQIRPVRIDFEGVGELASPRDFYAGGSDSAGHPGRNDGVEFFYGFVQLDTTPGCCGAPVVGEPPSGHAVLNLALDGSEVILNVPRGFTAGLSFWYSANGNPVTFEVYEGPLGSGRLLKSVTILRNQNGAASARAPVYGTWTRMDIDFEGMAKSVRLSGRQANFAVDDLTLGGL